MTSRSFGQRIRPGRSTIPELTRLGRFHNEWRTAQSPTPNNIARDQAAVSSEVQHRRLLCANIGRREPTDHMGPFVVAILFAVVVALGVVRLFRLPVQWTGY